MALLEEEADTRTSVLGDLTLITVSTLTFTVRPEMEGDVLGCETYQAETGDRQEVVTSLNIQQRSGNISDLNCAKYFLSPAGWRGRVW